MPHTSPNAAPAGRIHEPRTTHRSFILRHPTKDPRHEDPETIEVYAPAFGERDEHNLESDLTIRDGDGPIGERIRINGRVLDGDGRPVRNQLVEI